jgi:hypothetical protein
MSLYGRTDSNTNKTKATIGVATSTQEKQIVFVDNTEASLNENRSRGIDAPGWWSYYTFTDCDGVTRHKAELMVTIADPDLNSNETQADDAIAADVASAVTISTQPANATTSSGGATFTVSTSTTGTPGTSNYQWQYQTATQLAKWTNATNTGIYTGTTGATLTLTGATSTYNGYKYRVKITSTGGTEEVISNIATLTFGT